MAKIVSVSVIKKNIENSTKAEAVKIVNKYVDEIVPKIKEELTERVISNLMSIAELASQDYKTEINIIFQDDMKQETTKPKQGAKNAGND